jgi:flagellin
MNIGIVANLLRENSINNNKTLGNSLEKLSTGLKINKASDDASALAISDKLRTQASGIKQGIDNANSAIAMMNIADKGMDELSNILDTIKAKAIQMNTDTTNEDGRKIIKTDILKLIESYDDIVCRTNYNQTPLLNGCASPFDFQVGDDSNEIISVNVDSVESRQMGEADPYKLKNFITGFNSMPFESPTETNFENNNFENGSTGWIVTNSVALSGITNITGFPMPLDTTYPSNTIGNKDTTALSMIYNTTFTDGKVILSSTGSSNNGYDVIRGPFLESESAINISKDAIITVNWSAEGGNDAYDVFGYLIDINTGESQIIMNETSASSAGTTVQESTITINKDGVYKFVFVSGTYDLSGGQALGATLNINGIEINNNGDSSSVSEPQIPSCDCTELNLIRNDDSPTLAIQAQNLMRVIDEALSQLNAQRANVGAGTNQLESSARNQVTNYVNIKNAESIIRDVSYEEESSNFNKANIIAQAGSYVQSQANEIDKQSVAQLLK